MVQLGSVHWKQFERFLFTVGCEFKREKGDHRIYYKAGIKRPLVIPREKHLPVFIILNNLRVLGISKEKYLSIMSKK